MQKGTKIKLRTYPKDPWSPDEVQQYIDSWQLTPEQVVKFWELRNKVSDVVHWKNEPETLLRFMLAPQGCNDAEPKFRKMIQWRLDNSVDTILEDYVPPQKLLENTRASLLHGFDKEGDPIYVERGGAVDVGSLIKDFGHGELLKYAVWTRELHTRGEWLDHFENLQRRRMKGITVVYDVKGLSTKHMNPMVLELFSDISKISQNYYPGPIKNIIIIRAPSIFSYVFSIVKHFFRQSLRNKMIFANKNHLEALAKFIDLEELPPSIVSGGTGRVAKGLPPLIGDAYTPPYSKACELEERESAASFGILPSAVSLRESDNESASSNESNSFVGFVLVSSLVKGHWVEDFENGSQVFTNPVA